MRQAFRPQKLQKSFPTPTCPIEPSVAIVYERIINVIVIWTNLIRKPENRVAIKSCDKMLHPMILTPGPSLANRFSKAVVFYLTFILLYRISSASPTNKFNVFKSKSK